MSGQFRTLAMFLKKMLKKLWKDTKKKFNFSSCWSRVSSSRLNRAQADEKRESLVRHKWDFDDHDHDDQDDHDHDDDDDDDEVKVKVLMVHHLDYAVQ